MPKAEYTRVSREFLDRVLDSPGETYEPRGLFLCRQEIDGEEVWTPGGKRQGVRRIEKIITED